jgi:hypothetical protein
MLKHTSGVATAAQIVHYGLLCPSWKMGQCAFGAVSSYEYTMPFRMSKDKANIVVELGPVLRYDARGVAPSAPAAASSFAPAAAAAAASRDSLPTVRHVISCLIAQAVVMAQPKGQAEPTEEATCASSSNTDHSNEHSDSAAISPTELPSCRSTSSSDLDSDCSEVSQPLPFGTVCLASPATPTLAEVVGHACTAAEMARLQSLPPTVDGTALAEHFPVLGVGQCGPVVRVGGCALKMDEGGKSTQRILREAHVWRALQPQAQLQAPAPLSSPKEPLSLPHVHYAGPVRLSSSSARVSFVLLTEAVGRDIEHWLHVGLLSPHFPPFKCKITPAQERECLVPTGADRRVSLTAFARLLSLCPCLLCVLQRALLSLHQCGYLHGDARPVNFLWDDSACLSSTWRMRDDGATRRRHGPNCTSSRITWRTCDRHTDGAAEATTNTVPLQPTPAKRVI